VGHGGEKYIAFTGSISIFILLANLLSVFPAFSAPTAFVYVPLACASLTFIYFNWQGVKHHGVGHYLLTFAGSPKNAADYALAFLLFPVELISTAARLLSLTVRLWANIFASDMLYTIFLSLLVKLTFFAWGKFAVLGAVLAILPIAVPMAFIGLHIFVAIIQAYVFYSAAIDLPGHCHGGRTLRVLLCRFSVRPVAGADPGTTSWRNFKEARMKKLAVVLMMFGGGRAVGACCVCTRSWSKRRIRAHRITRDCGWPGYGARGHSVERLVRAGLLQPLAKAWRAIPAQAGRFAPR